MALLSKINILISIVNAVFVQVNESASDYLQMGDLDYEKIKYIMTDGDYEQRSYLLQSLRWVSSFPDKHPHSETLGDTRRHLQ